MAAVNVITKSGSNSFHGELFEYFRNNHLDANLFFNNAGGPHHSAVHAKPVRRRGGRPIIKNKLLFFTNYEGFRVVQRQQRSPSCRTRICARRLLAISAAGPGGTFLPKPVIYNPYDVDPTTGLRRPFPGNKIPLGPTNVCAPRPTCVDPVTLAYLNNYVKAPNIVINGVAEYTDAAVRTSRIRIR